MIITNAIKSKFKLGNKLKEKIKNIKFQSNNILTEDITTLLIYNNYLECSNKSNNTEYIIIFNQIVNYKIDNNECFISFKHYWVEYKIIFNTKDSLETFNTIYSINKNKTAKYCKPLEIIIYPKFIRINSNFITKNFQKSYKYIIKDNKVLSRLKNYYIIYKQIKENNKKRIKLKSEIIL